MCGKLNIPTLNNVDSNDLWLILLIIIYDSITYTRKQDFGNYESKRS